MLVARHLVSRQASEFLAWREALRPARKQLLEPLGAICRDTAEKGQSRMYATETLADYAADDPHALFDLLADAEQFQFRVIFGKFASQQQAIALARQELEKQPGEKASEDEKEALAKRQGNTAIAMYLMGDHESLSRLEVQSRSTSPQLHHPLACTVGRRSRNNHRAARRRTRRVDSPSVAPHSW